MPDISQPHTFEANPEQRAVIEAAPNAHLLVVAGPGTGKTQVAAMRLVRLLNSGLQPAQILVLSFSRTAVATLTNRLAGLNFADERLLEDLRHLAIRTFDSWTFRVLRQGGQTASDLLSKTHDQNIQALVDLLDDEENQLLTQILSSIRHVIVDEFQDLPGVRSRMVVALLTRLIRERTGEIGFTVLGDPAQAIFRFANRASGEDVPDDPWLELQSKLRDGLTELSLLKNHRSTEKLASMANSMRKILRSKELNSDDKLAAMKRFLGKLPSSSEDVKLGPHWLESLPEGSLAVLTRTNGEAVRVSKMLLGDSNQGPRVPIRLRLSGDTPFAPAWIAEILYRFKPQSLSRNTFTIVIAKLVEQTDPGVLKLMQLPSPDVAWTRLVRASGASEATQSIDLGELRSRMDWPDAFPDDQVSDAAAVYITTIHQAKGMEFDVVALLGVDPDQSEARGAEDPLEEANVGFVAITRAAKHLGQIPSSCIHKGPYPWTGKGGRVRQVSWGAMVNVQLGLKGDIAATSFVDADVHGSDVAVETMQKSLAARAIELRGHKVILKKVSSDKEGFRAIDTRYNIHLQDGNETGLLIGQTSGQVAIDLLHLLWNRGYSLPFKIFNLRVAEIVSLANTGDMIEKVPEPWRSSRLWLGVSLVGTGDFKTWRRNAN